MALCDIVLINRYFGWYSQSGQLNTAAGALERELDALDASVLHRPILISEFGADTLPGCHADPRTLCGRGVIRSSFCAVISMWRRANPLSPGCTCGIWPI